MLKRLRAALRRFFFPPHGSPRWVMVLPYVVLGVLTLSLLVGGAYAWDYTNSPSFCGTSCHTMPPEYAAYQISPHARIACVECHIGREFIGNQIFRKAGDVRHIVANTFKTYEYPIRVKNMRPARETCEKCHSPEKFSDDSLRVISHFQNDEDNTPYSLYLVLKTGGGAKREGLGRGIHWHIVSKVYYYPTDSEEQNIPFVRVVNDDGSTVDFVDVESDFDSSSVDSGQLKEMDCITCHNRITHRIYTPEESLDRALALGQIPQSIPEIREKGIEVLEADYTTQAVAQAGIAGLESYYKMYHVEFYELNSEKVAEAIHILQQIYADSVFIEQKVDWNSHPTNVGHIDSPGCFRCHDGKHLNNQQEAVRLECNLCHSIPVVAGVEDFVTEIEISRGREPESHLNPNWISLHNQVFGESCSACHTTDDPGGTSNTSFCSNSACHGNVYTFAGFDAPRLREILEDQLPAPEPTPELPALDGAPTFENYAGPLFALKCADCHGELASGGLNLLTYAGLMSGSSNGAVVIPGDAANSVLFQLQSAGGHFANLTSEELAVLEQWIDAGAPEQ
ncbi:MAG TPA: NapC/NirT family cytochrome c [Anaerolineales bacterium]|nr:NapC/NirT family cytochrome c [Anaerolineales bacterium]